MAHLVRITPTCVGKTQPCAMQGVYHPDHPHVCGEDGLRRDVGISFGGSPPRVWGRLEVPFKNTVVTRITPTCVGKTGQTPSSSTSTQDHPHVCGEDIYYAVVCGSIRGSPPRVWGRRGRSRLVASMARITPTCVGKTQMDGNAPRRLRDHPHVCGEDLLGRGRAPQLAGSPPRVWGRLIESQPVLQKLRITPTCVGKTQQRDTS